jgi:peptidoglycan/LPS O-acetylase OafA/YrhL
VSLSVESRQEAAAPRDGDDVHLPYMPALDGLRGLAVAGVLLFHAGHLVGGYLGVDLFFVLSGFLITSLLVTEGQTSTTIDLARFWARRARRLLPALALVMVAVVAYAWLMAQPAELARIRGDGLATLAYVANWRAVVADQDYFDLFVSPSPLQHTWSLAIEEQFYLAWPLVVLGLVRWRRGKPLAVAVGGVCVVGAVASAAAMTALHDGGDPSRVYYGTDTRVASILVGAALAAWLAARGPARGTGARRGVEAAGLAGVVVVAVAWTSVEGSSDGLYRGGLFLLAVATAAVIAAAAHPEAGPLARALRVAPLRWLGLVSYGVYLWHWPVYVVVDGRRTGLEGWSLVAVRVAVTLVFATASYVLVEQPVRRGRPVSRALRWTVPAVAALLVIGLVVSTLGAEPVVETADARRDTPGEGRREAELTRAGTQRLMVVGNSVGLFLGKGFDQLDPDPPLAVFNAAPPGCTFPTGATRARNRDGTVLPDRPLDCTRGWERDVAQFDPTVVVLALGDAGDGEVEYRGAWVHACMDAYDRWYRQSLQRAVDVLSADGATVAIVTPAYSRNNTLEVRYERTDCVNAINRSVAAERPEAILVDVARHVCPTTPSSCRREIDGVELRSDGLHYRDEGARLMARWILEEIRSR